MIVSMRVISCGQTDLLLVLKVSSINVAIYHVSVADDGAALLNKGSYMSAHVLLNLLNELKKEIKCEACRAFYLFFATSFINSIIHEHEC